MASKMSKTAPAGAVFVCHRDLSGGFAKYFDEGAVFCFTPSGWHIAIGF
jgi:hypothetical protein